MTTSRASAQILHLHAFREVVALETGPLVIDGMMYFTSDLGSYAIDADTCAEKWRRVREVANTNGYGAHRGFGYLDGTLFRGTSDGHVIALDAKDGRTKWDVTALDIAGPGVAMPMAPIAYDHKVFIGNAGGGSSRRDRPCLCVGRRDRSDSLAIRRRPLTRVLCARPGAIRREKHHRVADSGRRSRSTRHDACSMYQPAILRLISTSR